MAQSLKGCKVAVLALDGFEQAELFEPQRALVEAGATVRVISAKPGKSVDRTANETQGRVSGRLSSYPC